MKKKIWLIILSTISVLACTFGFAACDKGKTPGASEDPPATHEHVMQEVQAKDATCAEEGNIHYFYCGDCQKYFEDEAGAHELNADSIQLSKTTDHVYGAYTKTAEGHTRTCSVCGTPESGSHSYVNGKCSVCDYEHQDHSFGSYTKDENGHSRTCTVCGKVESDSHSYENGKCSVCEYEHQKHEFGDYISNEDGHSHTCNTCGKTVSGNHTYENGRCTTCEHDHQNHSFDSYTTDEETHTHTCSVCHKTESDSHIYADGKCSVCQYEHKSHTFEAYTKTEEGHTHTCSVCHKEESDSHSYENGKCSVCEYEHQSHTFEAYTKTEDTHTHTCSVCHKSESDNHAYANGTCTVCEYEHQHHTFGQYSTSDEEHFHTCDVCHKVESGKHTYENGKCSVCDYAPEAHSFGPYQCTEEGHTRTCNDCEKVESDEHVYENGKCKICQYEHKNHVYGNYSKTEEGHTHTCTVCHKVESGTHEYENGKCTVCQYEHLNHSFGNYTSDASTHAHTCDVCGLAESGSHTYKEGKCTTCEYEHTDHKFGSYTSDDSTHSHTCDICQKVESSSHEYVNGTCSICRHEHVEHSFGAWTQQDASCTENGYKEHTCDVCHKTVREEITSPGHSFDEHGICGKCGDVRDFLAFKTLQADEDGTVYGKVSNVTEIFSFIDEVTAGKGVTFTVSTDLQGQHTIPTKTTSLNIGDNTFYLLATKGEDMKLFTVTVRRRPVYTVLFETSGSAVLSQQVEEDSMIAVPEETTMTGYTFQNWTLNGNAVAFPYTVEEGIPQTSDYTVTMTAVFTANVYTVTLDAKGGEVSDSEQTVTFDHSYNFPVPTRTGYTFVGWYEGDNKLTGATGASHYFWKYTENKQLEAHWSANSYKLTVECNPINACMVTGGGSFDYDSNVTVTATAYLGYTFLGWYNEAGEQLSKQESYTFLMGLEQTLTAKWQSVPEMANFNFTSTETTCTIFGVIDNTLTEIIVPDYVTSITEGTFKGCSQVESMTLPFIGGERKTANDTYQYPFGYIFGPTSFSDATQVKQYYYGENTSSTILSYYYIPSSLKSITVTGGEILYGAFWQYSWLESVTLGNDVLSIGNCAFYGCSGLESVIWNAKNCTRAPGCYNPLFGDCPQLTSVTFGENVETIPDYAFQNCVGLTMLSIPESVTSIGSNAFSGCSGLKSVIWNAENCARAGWDWAPIFAKCGRLEAVTFGENVKTVPDDAFSGVSAVTGVYITNLAAWCEIDFGGTNANPLSRAEHLYVGGEEVNQLVIPDEATKIGAYAFYLCTWLTIGNLNIPNSVISIGDYAFYGCSGLESVTIGNDVTEIGEEAFYDCSGLTGELKIPDSVTSIGKYAFEGCSGLTSVTIGNGVTFIGGRAFCGCSGLESIEIPDSVTSIGSEAFYNCSGLAGELKIPESVTTIGEEAFYDCSGLTSVTIGRGVTSIGRSAFKNCTLLESIIWNAENCTTAGDHYLPIFSGGTNLRTVSFGEKVKTIPAYAFRDCPLAGELKIPESVTTIGEEAFYDCSGLTGELKIPDSVTSIGDSAFNGCSGLTSVTIGSSVTSIGSSAFSRCSGLESVTIGNSVTEIGSGAFYDCGGLESIEIPESVTSIRDSAFSRCSGLTSVTIGNSVTVIGSYAFSYCKGLQSVTIPASVMYIGKCSFYECSNLTNMKFEAPTGWQSGEPYEYGSVEGPFDEPIKWSPFYSDLSKSQHAIEWFAFTGDDAYMHWYWRRLG